MDWETPGGDEKLNASNSDLLPELGGSDTRRFWAAIAIAPVIAQAPPPHGPVPRF